MSVTIRRDRSTLRRLAAGVGLVLACGLAFQASVTDPPAALAAAGCRIYVASGDDVTNGKELNDNAKRYPEQLLADHLISPGWCLFNQGKDGQTSATYITGGGLANAYNMRPDLLSIQLGEQNNPIVNLIKDCFDKVKDHDFTGANACAAAVLGNSSAWTNLRSNFTTILQQTRIMASQRPGLVIAVVGYHNPYPHADTALLKMTELCTPLVDTIPTCIARWAQLPPALLMLDQAFIKLNDTLKLAMAPFNQGPNGWRWVYVDTYTPMRDHCMTMKVLMRTTVNHGTFTDEHDNPTDVNFGCDPTWIVEGSTGTKTPDYLDPASDGVLVAKSQTTQGMGVFPNADGHACIDEAIWEADTIDPGTTPLKWKLGYGEPAETDICQ